MSRVLILTFALMTMISALSGSTAFSQQPAEGRVDAGEEPPNGPIIYGLLPPDGAVIPQDELKPVRAGATIETRRDASIESAKIFVDGESVERAALLGPYPYLQSASVDLKGLKPGKHEIRVVATDTGGRTGGHTWSFTVAPADTATYSRVVDNSEKMTTGRFDASANWGSSSWNLGRYGTDYRFALPNSAASDTASYRFDLPAQDTYTVYGWWPKDRGYNSRVPVGVKTTAGWQWVYADQSDTGGRWVYLGSFEMNAGDDWNIQISR